MKHRLFLYAGLLAGLLSVGGCGGDGGGGDGGAPAPLTSVALPKTGQTTCYDAANAPVACTTAGIPPGQDGASQIGVAEPSPRFTAGAGATVDCVTDNLTGLMWTQNANLPGIQTWQAALDYANSLNLCGYTDWRLSNPNELSSLINYNLADNVATLNTLGFSNVQANDYWSSSSYAGSATFVRVVNMKDGEVGAGSKIGSTGSKYVWPVRAGR